MAYEIGQQTAKGPARPYNQDALLVEVRDGGTSARPWILAAVADGLGGEPGGEVASELAVTTLRKELTRTPRIPGREAIEQACVAAHRRIRCYSTEAPDLRRMGTTLSALVASDDHAIIASVGDSRVYATDVGQVTRDHSVVAEQIRGGFLTEAEAMQSPFRNMVTRFLGVTDALPEVDIFGPLSLTAGQRFLICSDGIHGAIGDEAIMGILQQGSCQEAAERLVETAQTSGGTDDASAIVIAYSRSRSSAPLKGVR
jgi:protein phosphatase